MKRILSIAGTDPTGGAGIQADLKSISALGGYGMAVVTALVAQNTHGVRGIHTPPTAFLRQQLDSVSDDVRIDAVKIGMLGDAATVAEVINWLRQKRPPNVVLDPVMVATSGDRLLAADAEHAMLELLDQVDMITPNLAELALLMDEPVAETWSDALDQGRRLMSRHDTRVLVKGGHLPGRGCPDALLVPGAAPVEITMERIDTVNTHGTGCSMSSGLATLKARTGDWQVAFEQTKSWLQEAIGHADDLDVGAGHGPIHHFYRLYAAAGMTDAPSAGTATDTTRDTSETSAGTATDPAGPHTTAL
jgi:hydroxymethylpyrimidine kinase/phosphomethylpyrimidine kinase